ncbi:MAG: hypothetical protein HYY93_13430 [Planctomycetes bacterium]|nr:hypothetical protein [Planctomycetota bacterium]
MSTRHVERWIRIANTGLALGAILLSIHVALRSTPPGTMREFTGDAQRRVEEGAGEDPVPIRRTLQDYEPIWRWCNVTGCDPPPHPTLDSLLSVQGLKENASDPRRSCAFITLVRTRETLNAYMGDTIEGARVSAITGPDAVEFDYFGERVTLTLVR